MPRRTRNNQMAQLAAVRKAINGATPIVDVGHQRRHELTLRTPNLGSSVRSASFQRLALHPRELWNRLVNMSRLCRVSFTVAVVQSISSIILQNMILYKGTDEDDNELDLGQDRKAYTILIVFGCAYTLILAIFSLTSQSIAQVTGYVLFNALIVIYGCMQVYQYFDSPSSGDLGRVPLIAVLSCIVLGIQVISSFFFAGFLFPRLQVDFGRSLYERIGGDPVVHSILNSYEMMIISASMSCTILSIYFVVSLALLLPADHWDFTFTAVFLPLNIIINIMATRAAYNAQQKRLYLFVCYQLILILYNFYQFFALDGRTCSFCSSDEDGNFLFMTFSSIINIIAILVSVGTTLKCIRALQVTNAVEFTNCVDQAKVQSALSTSPSRSQTLNSGPSSSRPGSPRADSLTEKSKTFSFLSTDYMVRSVSGHRKRNNSRIPGMSPRSPLNRIELQHISPYAGGIPTVSMHSRQKPLFGSSSPSSPVTIHAPVAVEPVTTSTPLRNSDPEVQYQLDEHGRLRIRSVKRENPLLQDEAFVSENNLLASPEGTWQNESWKNDHNISELSMQSIKEEELSEEPFLLETSLRVPIPTSAASKPRDLIVHAYNDSDSEVTQNSHHSTNGTGSQSQDYTNNHVVDVVATAQQEGNVFDIMNTPEAVRRESTRSTGYLYFG